MTYRCPRCDLYLPKAEMQEVDDVWYCRDCVKKVKRENQR